MNIWPFRWFEREWETGPELSLHRGCRDFANAESVTLSVTLR